jgi:hypothetical protein
MTRAWGPAYAERTLVQTMLGSAECAPQRQKCRRKDFPNKAVPSLPPVRGTSARSSDSATRRDGSGPCIESPLSGFRRPRPHLGAADRPANRQLLTLTRMQPGQCERSARFHWGRTLPGTMTPGRPPGHRPATTTCTREPDHMSTARALRDDPWPSTPERARAALALVRVVERARTRREPERTPAPPAPRPRRTRAQSR